MQGIHNEMRVAADPIEKTVSLMQSVLSWKIRSMDAERSEVYVRDNSGLCLGQRRKQEDGEVPSAGLVIEE